MNNLTEYQCNIYSVYSNATAEDKEQGMNWYTKANQLAKELSALYGIPASQICGVIAALSPGNTWEKNLADTKTIIEYFVNSVDLETAKKVGAYGRHNMNKAWKILEGYDPAAVLGGLKVQNFYVCIKKPRNTLHICLDRHAVCIAVGERLGDRYTKYLTSAKRYNMIADAYRMIASLIGILPNQLQAITWCSWRRIHSAKVDAFM